MWEAGMNPNDEPKVGYCIVEVAEDHSISKFDTV